MKIDLLIDLPDKDLALFTATATLRGTTAEELIREALVKYMGGTYLPLAEPDKSIMRPLVHVNLVQS